MSTGVGAVAGEGEGARNVARWRVVGMVLSMAVLGGAVLALVLGEPLRRATGIVALAVAGALAAELIGGVLLFRLRSRTLWEQALVAALVPTLAVGAGTALAAAVMVVSAHDASVLLVILATAGTFGVLSATLLAERVAAASRSLGGMAREIADGTAAVPGADDEGPAEPAELAQVRSELRTMSLRLEAARERQEALEEARRELVSWVSHDLRTPIADIRALVEALEDRVVDDPATVARYHRTILTEADRLGALVDDLFELSRIHAGSVSLDRERVALSDLVSDTLSTLGPVAEARGVELLGEVTGPVPEVEVSLPEIMRVLHNLVDNAVRHTPERGTVRVEATTEDEDAVVCVLDTCGGIPPDELGRVFDVAFRGDEARRIGGGAGLGLAIAQGLVQAHGGRTTVENADRGCRFTMRLPRSGHVDG